MLGELDFISLLSAPCFPKTTEISSPLSTWIKFHHPFHIRRNKRQRKMQKKKQKEKKNESILNKKKKRTRREIELFVPFLGGEGMIYEEIIQ